jgi:hypothetical protein
MRVARLIYGQLPYHWANPGIGRQGRTRTDRLSRPLLRRMWLPNFTTCRWLPSDDSNIVSRINNPLSYRLDDRGSIGGTSRNRTDRTVLAKHRRRALVHAVPWNPRTESNRRSTGFVIRCLSAWLRGCDTASCRDRGPSRPRRCARRPTTAPANRAARRERAIC